MVENWPSFLQKACERLEEFLPAHWSHNNPIDVLGDADSEHYARALDIAAQDPNSDGLLVILSPQGMTDPALVAERLIPYAKSGKPVLASWMGGSSVAAGEAVLNAGGIPTFPYPDTAARAFTYMWRYTYVLRGLYETPALAELKDAGASRHQAEQFIQNARQQGRVILNELESKQVVVVLRHPHGGNARRGQRGRSCEDGVGIGFSGGAEGSFHHDPHKTDVGGVKLNLQDEAAVRAALIAKSSLRLRGGSPRKLPRSSSPASPCSR